MQYVIATDSRQRPEVLFMVDRRKQKKSFWSCYTIDAMIYGNKKAAEDKAKSLRYNNPRVMTITEALVIDEQQNRSAREEQYERDREWAMAQVSFEEDF